MSTAMQVILALGDAEKNSSTTKNSTISDDIEVFNAREAIWHQVINHFDDKAPISTEIEWMTPQQRNVYYTNFYIDVWAANNSAECSQYVDERFATTLSLLFRLHFICGKQAKTKTKIIFKND